MNNISVFIVTSLLFIISGLIFKIGCDQFNLKNIYILHYSSF